MKVKNFSKMQGLGNDFIVFDCREQLFDWTKEEIKKYANRNWGIGFDQLLIIEKSTDKNLDFAYRIFNADGSEVEHCGNGARCFGKFLLDNHIFNFERPAKVKVKKGIIEISYCGKDSTNCDLFRVDMGVPNFTPFTKLQNSILKQEINIDNQNYSFGIVSMGNPHAVNIVENVDNAEVAKIGQFLQNNHPLFPESVNVGFMQIVDRNKIKLRVFERGVGETQACGTGACAAASVGIALGLLDKEVEVYLLGGILKISWNGGENNLFMTGAAENVFSGKIV